MAKAKKLQRILPEIGTVIRNIPVIIRSALIGVGIGAVPGIGEDIAGWVSYGTAKNTSKHPETFGKGELKGVTCQRNGEQRLRRRGDDPPAQSRYSRQPAGSHAPWRPHAARRHSRTDDHL